MARTHSTKKKSAKKGRKFPHCRTKHSLEKLHECFEAFLPRLRVYIRFELKKHFCRDFEDAVQEAIAAAWVSYFRLAHRGIDGSKFVSKLAYYAVRYVRNGSRIAGGVRKNDVLAWKAQMKHGFRVQALVVRSNASQSGWRELVIEDKRTTPAEIAICRMDFDAWLKTLPRRKRRIAVVLSLSHSTKETAKRFHVSWGRISQLRRELAESWREYHLSDEGIG